MTAFTIVYQMKQDQRNCLDALQDSSSFIENQNKVN